MSPARRLLPYVPIEQLDGRPHIMVDGAPRPGTVLTLSHWPASPTPVPLWRDLSAEIAFACLDGAREDDRALAVTNDHLDIDGLVALYALVDPERAFARRELLVEVARVGDFSIVADERAAQVAFAIATLCDPHRSPWAGHLSDATSWTAGCYRDLLELLPELLDHTGRFASLFEEEFASLAAGRELVASGRVTVTEHGEAGLAAVRLPVETRDGPQFACSGAGHLEGVGVHPAVIHGLTESARVLVTRPGSTLYYDRYETWVRVVSRRLPLRRDLAPLAARLSAAELSGAAWVATAPGSLVPVLRHEGESGLDPEDVLGEILGHLASAPAAWDPFRTDGANGAAPARAAAAGVSAVAASRSGTSGRGRARSRGRWRARPSA